jgi:hypothetical protein
MNENGKVIGIDDTGHAHVMRGTLKLFTHFQITESSSNACSSDRGVYKQVTLATYYGVKSTSDFHKQIEKFKFLNPTMKNVHISYEYVIRAYG